MTSVPIGQLSRRRLLQTTVLAATVAFWELSATKPTLAAPTAPAPPLNQATVTTLEAYADTIVPGQPRFAGDVAVAGAAPGPSAAAVGALQVFQMPDVALNPVLPDIARLLNGRTMQYAGGIGLALDPTLPPFVAMSFDHRTALAARLLTVGDPDHNTFVLMATLSSWAFDTAGAQSTVAALRANHGGLAWIQFPRPRPDGTWQFSQFSYGRRLATPHPTTTRSGSPT